MVRSSSWGIVGKRFSDGWLGVCWLKAIYPCDAAVGLIYAFNEPTDDFVLKRVLSLLVLTLLIRATDRSAAGSWPDAFVAVYISRDDGG